MDVLEEAPNHIHEAICLGRTDIVKTLLAEVKAILKAQSPKTQDVDESFDTFLNLKHKNNRTFLHQAVKLRQRDVMRALLQEGGDASIKCKTEGADGDIGVEENALEAARRLIGTPNEEVAENSFTQIFGEVLLQATAASR